MASRRAEPYPVRTQLFYHLGFRGPASPFRPNSVTDTHPCSTSMTFAGPRIHQEGFHLPLSDVRESNFASSMDSLHFANYGPLLSPLPDVDPMISFPGKSESLWALSSREPEYVQDGPMFLNYSYSSPGRYEYSRLPDFACAPPFSLASASCYTQRPSTCTSKSSLSGALDESKISYHSTASDVVPDEKSAQSEDSGHSLYTSSPSSPGGSPFSFSSRFSSSTDSSRYYETPVMKPITLDSVSRLFPSQGSRAVKEKKLHVCPICGKTFPRPSGLRTHLNAHKQIRPYHCMYPGCDKAFTVKSNAKRHVRTHGIVDTTKGDSFIISLEELNFPPSPTKNFRIDTPLILPSRNVESVEPPGTRLKWVPPSVVGLELDLSRSAQSSLSCDTGLEDLSSPKSTLRSQPQEKHQVFG